MTKPFARLGELVRSFGTGEVSKAIDSLGEQRAVQNFERVRGGSARGKLARLGVVVAMMATAVILSSMQLVSKTALSWTVEGSSSQDLKYISPARDREAMVRFSEGSELRVRPGSRLRIADAGRKTVKAVLETGASRVSIAGRSTTAWKIEAGPFSISPSAVASLMVEWLADELLRVSVFEGETSVEGTPSPLVLHAGQRVSANATTRTVEVGPLALAPIPDASASSEARIGMPDEAPAREPGPAQAPPVALPAPGSKRIVWSDAVAQGDFSGVLLDAERRGISIVLTDAPLSDLVALADAARLTGKSELARRALLAQRARFPRSSSAKDAAFFLGRITDDYERAPGSAIPWYDAYLSEAPSGHFAAEAFGRKMMAITKQSGRAAAKESAAEYLKRFPTGPHAQVARELLGE
jgi:TolA-binding protein